jgi:hypothetical protein
MKPTVFFAFLFALFTFSAPGAIHSSVCRVSEKGGRFSLTVDGKPFVLKGVCCPINKKSRIDYFQLCRELGANTVRNWGIDQGSEEYLDAAARCGLKVDQGIWLPHCNPGKGPKVFSYLKDKDQLAEKEKKFLAYIDKHKKHPAILMWNLGNEVLFNIKDEDERAAFCQYLESLAKKVKSLDPDHPTLYTCFSSKMFHYLKDSVPSLDIIGVNTYSDVDGIQQEWKKLNIGKPYLVTEFGCLGPWDRKKDAFGEPSEEADHEKAFKYNDLLEQMEKHAGSCLGGFAFRIGEPKRRNANWWALTLGNLKKEAFRVVQKHYRGKDPLSWPPVLISAEADKSTVRRGEKISLDIRARDRENNVMTYGIRLWKIKKGDPEAYVPEITSAEKTFKSPKITFQAPQEAGLYTLFVFAFDGKDNVATQSMTIKVKD